MAVSAEQIVRGLHADSVNNGWVFFYDRKSGKEGQAAAHCEVTTRLVKLSKIRKNKTKHRTIVRCVKRQVLP